MYKYNWKKKILKNNFVGKSKLNNGIIFDIFNKFFFLTFIKNIYNLSLWLQRAHDIIGIIKTRT